MFASTLLFASLMLRQGDAALDQKVTFQCPATVASAAMARLSQVTGTPLSAQLPTSGEMLVLRFKDVPLRVAMDKIAEAAHGRWTKTETGYTLTRPGDVVRAIEHQQRTTRIDLLRKALSRRMQNFDRYDSETISKLFDALQATRKKSEPEDRRARLATAANFYAHKPGERLVTRMLASVGIDQLADLPDGQRVVFSTRPTPMQHGLPSAAFDAIAAFGREQAIWFSAPMEPAAGSHIDRYVDPEVQNYRGPDLTKTSNVLMVCTPDWADGTLQINLKIADRTGAIISTARSGIFLNEADEGPDPNRQKIADKAFTLSPLAAEMKARFAIDVDGTPTPKKPLSPALKALLLDPEHHDPLELFPSEPLLAAGEAANLNIAACIDDSSFRVSLLSDATTQQALADGTIKDGWYVASPDNPLKPVHESRAGLASFVRAVTKEYACTLDMRAAYAQHVDSFQDSFGQIMTGVLEPDLPISGDEDWLFVRLYGMLSPTQRDIFAKGGHIALNDLFSAQQSVVGQIVFSREIEDIGEGDSKPSDSDEAPKTSLANEPTEVLPNGLDNRVSVTMSTAQESALFASFKSEEGEISPMAVTDIMTVALSMMMSEFSDVLPGMGMQTVDGFRLGQEETHTLKILVPRQGSDSEELTDAHLLPGPVLGFDKLPADLRQQILSQVDTMRKAMKEVRERGFQGRGGGQGSGVPPPR
ncbi:MAG TPA: hypothetical protein VHE55_00155 [Fimbriimonadaceae bacterium]|nr:hypothetical protein [Fimbriimonadaceae bacterium]